MYAKELKRAQNTLTESNIRGLWSTITRARPHMCVHDGIRLDFARPFSSACVDSILEKLLKCSHTGKTIATPIYGYNYEPDNVPPHHAMAITLFFNPKTQTFTLNMFNPKGKDSPRKKKEIRLMKAIGARIRNRTHLPVNVYYYNGPNIQENDTIGLCQLYSLLYLYEFIQRPNGKPPSKTLGSLQKHTGSIDPHTLLGFWNKTIKQRVPKTKLFGSTKRKPSKRKSTKRKPSKRKITKRKPSKRKLTKRKPSKRKLTKRKPSKRKLTKRKPLKRKSTKRKLGRLLF